MICASTFKNGTPCIYKSKFVIETDENRSYVCGRHVVSLAKQILGRDIDSIEDVPEVIEISKMDIETDAIIMDILTETIASIKQTTGLKLKKQNHTPMSIADIDYYKVTHGDKFLSLMICKDELQIVELYEAMCVQVRYHHCNVFLPLKSYEVMGEQYFVSKLVQTIPDAKVDSTIRRVPYFYQLCSFSRSLREFAFDKESTRAFTIHMCNLIERLHSTRMCFGDFNYDTIVITDIDDIKSAVIDSAKNVSFWMDTHGEFKSEDRSGSGTKFPLTSSRRVHLKKVSGRYDDFESLLYLLLTIQGNILPWNDSTSVRDCNLLKKCFLEDPSLYMKSSESLNALCDMIVHSEYDERPTYHRIVDLFEKILS